jgi:hypothetical protein
MNIEKKFHRVNGVCYLSFYLVKKENEVSTISDFIIEFRVKRNKVILEKCLNMEYLPDCEEKAKEFVKAHKKFI